MSQNEDNLDTKIPLENGKKQSVLAAFWKHRIKFLLAALLVFLILYSVVPGTWLLQPQKIQWIQITRITYPNGVMDPKYQEILIRDKEKIARFGANFANTLLIFWPDDTSASGHETTKKSVNYYVNVGYETTIKSMNLFDSYGNPLDISGRTLWFALFRSKKKIYQEIDSLFQEAPK